MHLHFLIPINKSYKLMFSILAIRLVIEMRTFGKITNTSIYPSIEREERTLPLVLNPPLNTQLSD